jgi:hypothetical protein
MAEAVEAEPEVRLGLTFFRRSHRPGRQKSFA